MPSFGRASHLRVITLREDLRMVLEEAIKHTPIDFSVIEGHRTEERQEEFYAQGRTTPGKIVTNAKGGESPHNQYPSPAVDIVPYINGRAVWDDDSAWNRLAGYIVGIANANNVDIMWGADFRNLKDSPHFEVISNPLTGMEG